MAGVLNNDFIIKISTFAKWLSSQEYDFSFNNREIAFGIIIFIFLIWILQKKNIRIELIKLLHCLINKYFIRIYFEILIYSCFMVVVLYKMGLWSFNYTKDVLLWILFSALYLSFKVADTKDDKKIFRNIMKDTVGFAVFVEFLLNVYTFSIIAEVLLIVFISIVSMMIAYTEVFSSKDPGGRVNKLMYGINVYIGLNILLFLTSRILTQSEDLININTLKSFILPIILTVMFIPYLNYLLLWTTYKNVPVPIWLSKSKHKQLLLYFKFRMYLKCKLSRKKVADLIKTKKYLILNIKNKKDVDDILSAI